MTRALPILACLLLLAGAAHAQPPADGPPSDSLARALRAYQAERYEEARPLFEASATGRQPEATTQRQRAQAFLAKTLFHLDRWVDALAAFEVIAQAGSAHPYFDPSFHWLVELHEHLPPASEPQLVGVIGRYEEAIIDRDYGPSNREGLATACYLLGRARYAAGRYFDALRLFRRVPEQTRVSRAAEAWHRRTLATVGPQ